MFCRGLPLVFFIFSSPGSHPYLALYLYPTCIVLVLYLYRSCIVLVLLILLLILGSPNLSNLSHPTLYCTCIALVLSASSPSIIYSSLIYPLCHLVLYLYCSYIVLVLSVLPLLLSPSHLSNSSQPHLILYLYRTCIVNPNPSSPLSHPTTRPRTHPR